MHTKIVILLETFSSGLNKILRICHQRFLTFLFFLNKKRVLTFLFLRSTFFTSMLCSVDSKEHEFTVRKLSAKRTI